MLCCLRLCESGCHVLGDQRRAARAQRGVLWKLQPTNRQRRTGSKNHAPSGLVNAVISNRKSHLWCVSAICNTQVLELLQPFLCCSLFLCWSIKGPAISFLPLSLFFISSLYLSLCLYVAHGGRCLSSTFARVLVSITYRWDRLPTPCGPCSRAHFGRLATACVSSPRDWTVSIGSHMQQNIDMFKAPPHLGAPIPLFGHRSHLKSTKKCRR